MFWDLINLIFYLFLSNPHKKKKNLNNLFKTSKRDYNDSKNQNPIEIIKKIFLGLNILFTHVQMKTLHSLNSSLQDEFIDIKIRFLFLLESGLPTMFPLFFHFFNDSLYSHILGITMQN